MHMHNWPKGHVMAFGTFLVSFLLIAQLRGRKGLCIRGAVCDYCRQSAEEGRWPMRAASGAENKKRRRRRAFSAGSKTRINFSSLKYNGGGKRRKGSREQEMGRNKGKG